MSLESRYAVRELLRNSRKELASVPSISTASRKEKAGSELAVVRESLADSLIYCSLSRASHAVQPEYTSSCLMSLGPIPGFGDRSLFACREDLSHLRRSGRNRKQHLEQAVVSLKLSW